MKVIILTEKLGTLHYEISKRIKIEFPSYEVLILEAKDYFREKSIFDKIKFLFFKFKKRGLIYYLNKILEKIKFTFSNFKKSNNFYQKIKLLNIKHKYVNDHSIDSIGKELLKSHFLLVVGCRVLTREVCNSAPSKSYVYHSADPRFVKGVTLPSFWEVIHDFNNYRLSIISLKTELDSGDIIYQSEFPITNDKNLIREIELVNVPYMFVETMKGKQNILPYKEKRDTMFKKEINKYDLRLFRKKLSEKFK